MSLFFHAPLYAERAEASYRRPRHTALEQRALEMLDQGLAFEDEEDGEGVALWAREGGLASLRNSRQPDWAD